MIAHLMNRSADILREVRQDDGRGGAHVTLSPVAEGVPVRVPQPTDTERVLAQQAGAEFDARVYFAAGTDVRRGDVLRAYFPREDFTVVAVYSGSAPGVYTRADVKRVQSRGAAR